LAPGSQAHAPRDGCRRLEHEGTKHMLQEHEMVLWALGGGLVPRHMCNALVVIIYFDLF